MNLVFTLLFLGLLPYFGMSKNVKGVDQRFSVSGGWLSTPNYPDLFDTRSTQYYFLKAPENHLIVLNFNDFVLKIPNKRGRTDVLRIIDGKRTNPVSTKFFWGKKSPFTYSSTTNRLLLIFKAYHQYPKKGFNATFHFVNKATHCDSTSLNTDLAEVTSCDNKVDVFATQCRVQCKRNSPEQVANCVNGKFTNVDCTDYCDQSSLQVSNGSVSSCNGIYGRASECEIACDQHFTGGGVAVCINQVFAVKKCIAKPDLVEKCEVTDMVECPFTLNDLMNYHQHRHLESNKNKNNNNEVTQATVTDDSGNSTKKTPKSISCDQSYCDKSFSGSSKQYNHKCGRDPYWGLLCFYCRYITFCGRPVPASVFG